MKIKFIAKSGCFDQGTEYIIPVEKVKSIENSDINIVEGELEIHADGCIFFCYDKVEFIP